MHKLNYIDLNFSRKENVRYRIVIEDKKCPLLMLTVF